jgi:hypothetical protein
MGNNTPFSVSKQSIQATLLYLSVQKEQHKTLSSKGPEPTPPKIEWWMVLAFIVPFLVFVVALLVWNPSASQRAGDHSNQTIDQSIHFDSCPYPRK